MFSNSLAFIQRPLKGLIQQYLYGIYIAQLTISEQRQLVLYSCATMAIDLKEESSKVEEVSVSRGTQGKGN
jgi:hypothetical protein